MYILIAILAASAYALQGTLMASIYRKMDPLSAISYRGLAIGCTSLPLLFFVPKEDFLIVPNFLLGIALCSCVGAFGNWFFAHSYKRLPVGVATALVSSFRTITAIGLAVYFLGEMLNSVQYAFIGLLLAFIAILSVSRNVASEAQFPRKEVMLGITFTLFSGIAIGCSMSLIGHTARAVHPLLIVFLWELSIGCFGFLLSFARSNVTDRKLDRINLATFRKIMLFSSPAVLGSFAFTYASKIGSIAIVSAVLSTATIFATAYALLFYREKLSWKQYAAIGCCCLAIVGLNLSEYFIKVFA